MFTLLLLTIVILTFAALLATTPSARRNGPTSPLAAHLLPVHPVTGRQALGIVRGKPVWPILGADNTLAGMLATQRSNIAAKLTERQTHAGVMETVRALLVSENRDPTDAEATQLREASDAKARIDGELDQLNARATELQAEKDRDDAADRLARENHPGAPRPAGGGIVTSEARTYSRDSARRDRVSFFRDAYQAFRDGGLAAEATERLQRHMREVAAEGEGVTRAATTGSYAGLVVPQYLIDQAALLARAGRPFANSVRSLPLPPEGMSLIVPRGTTGAMTGMQATENTILASQDQVWANLTIPVVTIGGHSPLSRQAMDRGEDIDTLTYADLVAAYAVNLDQQMMSGSGTSGQMLGVFNTAGINQASAFGAAATAQTFGSKVAGQINAVQTGRFLAPTAIAMHPQRFNWLTVQTDTAGRPLVVPDTSGPFNAYGIADPPSDVQQVIPSGKYLGLPVITDASVPVGVGTASEDLSLIYRASDLLLWEDGDGMPKQLSFEQTYGNQLSVDLVVYGYAAFTAARFPKASGVVGGVETAAARGTLAPTF